MGVYKIFYLIKDSDVQWCGLVRAKTAMDAFTDFMKDAGKPESEIRGIVNIETFKGY